MRTALVAILLGGCLSNPTVEVDQSTLEMPRGTSSELRIMIDGVTTDPSDVLLWSEDDERVSVTVSHDHSRLLVGGNFEGDAIVHVSAYGQDIAIPTHVAPPAIVKLWAEPDHISAMLGSEIHIRAKMLDTIAQVRDVTFDCRWHVRDENILALSHNDMMLRATYPGETTLHVSNGDKNAVVPVAIFK